MQRLTMIDCTGSSIINCNKCARVWTENCKNASSCSQEAVSRLAAIEEILGDDYDLDRLKELVEADKEGALCCRMEVILIRTVKRHLKTLCLF